MANTWAKWCACAALGLGAASPAQQTYRDEKLHWEADLPAGWVSAPELAAAANDLVKSRGTSANFQYVASFKSPGSAYIIFQFTPAAMGSVDLDTLESQLTKGMERGKSEVKEKFSDLISNAEFGKPVLDRVGKRIITRIQMTDQTGTALQALLVGHLAKDGVVQINCYAPASEFATYEPVFESISGSVRIDPGFAYDLPASSGGVDLPRILAVGAVCGAIGAVVALRRRQKGAARGG